MTAEDLIHKITKRLERQAADLSNNTPRDTVLYAPDLVIREEGNDGERRRRIVFVASLSENDRSSMPLPLDCSCSYWHFSWFLRPVLSCGLVKQSDSDEAALSLAIRTTVG